MVKLYRWYHFLILIAQPVEDIQAIQQVASISSGNDDVIGSLIAENLRAAIGLEENIFNLKFNVLNS